VQPFILARLIQHPAHGIEQGVGRHRLHQERLLLQPDAKL